MADFKKLTLSQKVYIRFLKSKIGENSVKDNKRYGWYKFLTYPVLESLPYVENRG